VEFYRGTDNMTADQLAAKANEVMSAYSSEEQHFFDGGEFLPLSVWERRGFDIQRIESRTRPEDVKDDDVLGKVFRVRIISTGVQMRVGNERKSTIQRKGVATLALPPPPNQLALEDGSVDDDSSYGSDSDSNNSSTTSSSDSHRKKKKKGGKKDKKSKKKSHKKSKKHDKKHRGGKKDKKTRRGDRGREE
jgi:hypothetical protein